MNTKNKKKIVLLCCRKNEKFSKKIIKFLKSKVILKIFFSEKYNEKLPKKFYRHNYDLIFCFRSYLILNKKILNKSKLSINVHPSLPKYRGVGCSNYAILNNDKYYGSTIHLINKKIDSGKIISIKKFKISKKINLNQLLSKVHSSMFLHAKNILKSILKNNLVLKTIKKNKNYNWSKKYNNLNDLNKLYRLNTKLNKDELRKILRSTNTERFKPYIVLHGEKFIYESSNK